MKEPQPAPSSHLGWGDPSTHLGAQEYVGGHGVSWRLAFLQGASCGSSAEPSRAQGGWSAAAPGGLAQSWPWQGCSQGQWTALRECSHPYPLPLPPGSPWTTGVSGAASVSPNVLLSSAIAPYTRTTGVWTLRAPGN